ncbi:hypothetical protein QFZ79_001139 [Arthrobacter sp. V4I6]|uniref:hypothetical protein n=1 Tax=Arthrobacter sp. V4I6 TaxID=3042281 RepID=UPI00277EBF24|nr:hypothetical protein [Arthrobacter sp. V4I6]MDQ0853028.1 hypothetical protein [Arthrobacter sp. V4I6]
MPALFESAALAVWQLLVLATIVVGTVAGSVYLARKHLASDAGLPDAVFWDSFAGLAVVVPAVIVPSLVSPWAGLMLGLLAAGTAGAAYRWAPRLFSWQHARRSSREIQASNAAAAVRHQNALARWRRYELDPAYCIDYPAMSDPARPETAAFLRAMKAAEQLRGGTDVGYGPAVDRLERALAEAERAAGAPAFSSPGVSRRASHLAAEGSR